MPEVDKRISDPQSYIHIQALSKRFGSVIAVDDLNISVEEGEFITFLGPSGSGKTTTLLMIAGFEEPTAGDIHIAGRSMLGMPPHRRDIGMVFQNYALFPHMTVRDNIAFPLQMRKRERDEIEERVGTALELVRLGGYQDRYPNQLSGGQQQRIAMARALVFNPSLLLMDEPLGALDRKLREEMQLELRHLHQYLNVTVIYVTHDQEEALVMSDRIAVMNHGRLEQIGSPEDLYEKPANRFVADFIGESIFIEGSLLEIREAESCCVVQSKGGLKIHASLDHSIENGSDVSVAIRPSRIMAAEGDEQLSNIFDGHVKEVIYLGETTKYHIVLNDKESIMLKRINRLTREKIQIGDRVRVGWYKEDAKVVV